MAWEKLGSASVGGAGVANTSWKELARTTLGSASDTITVDSIPARDNLMIIPYVYDEGSNQVYGQGRFNNDSGNNYANRWSRNGGSDTTNTSQSSMVTYFAGAAYGEFGVFEMANIAGQEKLLIDHGVAADATGAGTAPKRHEGVHKWANTSDQVTRFDYINGGSGTFGTGSEVVVLGYDNDEADSGTNFWQELASVDTTGDNHTTGTFTAKKYLWVQTNVVTTGGAVSQRMTFNDDTGSNYASRQSFDGGSDSTSTSGSNINAGNNDDLVTNSIGIANMFIVNKSDKEKLGMIDTNSGEASGAGNAPTRDECVFKWANTSSQITKIDFDNNKAGDWASGSYIKVYGAD